MLARGYVVLPGLGLDDVSKVDLPAEMFPTNYSELLACRSELEGAQKDAASYNMEIKKSTIEGAGLGLFAKIGMEKGTRIGYYWGKVLLAESLEARVLNDRILATKKYVIGEDRSRKYLHIVGCLRCAAGYANDPRTIQKKPNAQFLECGSVELGFQLVALILIDDVVAGEEVFADYGDMYTITSTPNAGFGCSRGSILGARKSLGDLTTRRSGGRLVLFPNRSHNPWQRLWHRMRTPRRIPVGDARSQSSSRATSATSARGPTTLFAGFKLVKRVMAAWCAAEAMKCRH
jgi:hypothetical protein